MASASWPSAARMSSVCSPASDARAVGAEPAVDPHDRAPPAVRAEAGVGALGREVVGQHLRVVGEERARASTRRPARRRRRRRRSAPPTRRPGACRSSVGQLGVERVVVGRPAGGGGEAGIVGQLGTVDRRPGTGATRRRSSSGQEQPAVGRAVEAVAGAEPGQLVVGDGPGRLAGVVERVVGVGVHVGGEHVDVDGLADAEALPGEQGQRHGLGERRRRCSGRGWTRWPASAGGEISRTSSSVVARRVDGGAGLVAGAAGGRAGARVRGRAAGARAVPAVAGERHPDQVGVVGPQLGLAERRGARRRRGGRCARRRRRCAASSRAIRRPSSCLRSMQIDVFPAVVLAAGVPPATRWRYGSPSSGSTLMTRAPRSASIDVAIGAAMIVANSTTVMPSSGRPAVGAPAVVGAGSRSARRRRASSASTSAVCCARRRRRPADDRRRRRQLGDRADRAHRPVHRVVERDDVAVADEVGVVERLGGRQERLGGDVAVGPEDRHPLVGRALLHAHEDHVAGRVDGRLVPRPGRLGEAVVDEQLAEQVGGVEERQQEVLEQVAALDPAAVASCAPGGS